MAFSIKNPEVDRLARQLARHTGESLTEAVEKALRERIERVQQGSADQLAEALLEIGRRVAALPVLDPRSPDEILGYDENGLPT